MRVIKKAELNRNLPELISLYNSTIFPKDDLSEINKGNLIYKKDKLILENENITTFVLESKDSTSERYIDPTAFRQIKSDFKKESSVAFAFDRSSTSNLKRTNKNYN